MNLFFLPSPQSVNNFFLNLFFCLECSATFAHKPKWCNQRQLWFGFACSVSASESERLYRIEAMELFTNTVSRYSNLGVLVCDDSLKETHNSNWMKYWKRKPPRQTWTIRKELLLLKSNSKYHREMQGIRIYSKSETIFAKYRVLSLSVCFCSSRGVWRWHVGQIARLPATQRVVSTKSRHLPTKASLIHFMNGTAVANASCHLANASLAVLARSKIANNVKHLCENCKVLILALKRQHSIFARVRAIICATRWRQKQIEFICFFC